MKKIVLLLMSIAFTGFVSEGQGLSANLQKEIEINNVLTESEIAGGVLTTEIMWKMGRIGASILSPEGKNLAYTVTNYSLKDNKGETSLFVMCTKSKETKKILDGVADIQWNNDGSKLYVLKDGQIYSVNVDGTALTQLSDIEGGVDGFGVASTGDKVFYVQKVAVEKRNSADVYPDMDKSKARIYDDLMCRHWNYWDKGEYLHIFVADLNNGKLQNAKDIMPGEAWDAPMAPYFDNAEIAWSNAGDKLAYTCKKIAPTVEYATSTDSDIYIYDYKSGATTNICKTVAPGDPAYASQMPGYDKYPVWSPDDKKIAFSSMRRAGNESDKDRLFVWDSETNALNYITADFDYNASNIVWETNKTLYFIAPMQATHQICRVDYKKKKVEVLTKGDHDINAFTKVDDKIIANIAKISMATELFEVNKKSGELTQVSFVNKHIYDKITLGNVQKRWVETTDGKQMLVWVVLPPNFDATKKYPTLLYCQGGPQSVVSQFWSFRWNFQLMAANGYIVVAPNRRGLPSFGQEWLDQISGDYSGQNIQDYLSAIDDVAKEPWSDETRLGCIGASYGGYSVFYLAGHHNKRFKALISHCGIFNFESMYGETEELFFINNDYGGPYWEKDNKVAQNSYAHSPHRFVTNWDTPILIITGEFDYRIPYTQSLEAFTAARVLGIDARLVSFENEAHQVFKPQNNMVWNREFFSWLDKYLK